LEKIFKLPPSQARQRLDNTYYAVADVIAKRPPSTFHDEYQAASVEDFEGAVTGVWDLLLRHYFSQSDGSVHRTQDRVRGYVDINSYRWVVRPNQARRVRTPFLVTQCRRTARENNKAAWDESFEQLKRYMKDVVAHSWPQLFPSLSNVEKEKQNFPWCYGRGETWTWH
jgi:hypothetical protein